MPAGVALVDLAGAQTAVLGRRRRLANAALGPARRGQRRDAWGLRIVARQEGPEAEALLELDRITFEN